MRNLLVLLALWSLSRRATASKDTLNCTTTENIPTNTVVCDAYGLLSNHSAAPDCSKLACSFALSNIGFDSNPDFDIDAKGVISTKRLLDREALLSADNPAVVHLLIEISHANGIDYKSFDVLVYDENDVTPTFSSPEERVEFKEDTPKGIRRFIQRAVDNDAGQNGKVSYEIVDGNEGNAFTLVVDTSGLVYLTPAMSLDRETLDHYVLNISARDGGRPPRSAYHLVNVTITDANDNDPVFLRKDFDESLKENSPANQVLFQASAIDADLGPRGHITYFLQSEFRGVEKQFSIDPVSGIIRTTALSFDYEQMDRSEYIFWLFAKDNGSSGEQPRTSEVEVTVNIIDVNDEPPEIKVSFHFRHRSDDSEHHHSLWEDDRVGTLLADVTLKDPDRLRGQKTHVTAKLENSDGYFIYDQSIGALKLGKSLDHETRNTFVMKLVASDNDQPPLTSEYVLNITVLDRNDNPPIFDESQYTGESVENDNVGKKVVRVHASDRDSGDNALVFYSIVSGSDSDWFIINRTTGWIKVASKSDRETRENVMLRIEASNRGVPRMVSHVNVTIRIKDDNDMTPTFQSTSYVFSLDENRPPETSVGQVNATDADIGQNSIVQYEMSSDNVYFSVERKSGIIRNVRPLDYERMTEHSFEVVAYDGGVIPRSSLVTVTVNVNDRNDNKPIFQHKSPLYVSISQLDDDSKILVTMEATDRDTEDGGRVTYSMLPLSSSEYKDLFNIGKDTGVVRVLHPLFYVEPNNYSYVIRATDNGAEIRRTSEIKLIIGVFPPGGPKDPQVESTQSSKTDGGSDNGITTIVIVLSAVLVVMLVILIAFVILVLRSQNRSICLCPTFGSEEEGIPDLKAARRSSSRVKFAVEDDVREYPIQFEYDDKDPPSERVDPDGENSPDKEEGLEIHMNSMTTVVDVNSGRSRKPLQASDEQELQREADEDSETESTDSGHHTADSASTPMSLLPPSATGSKMSRLYEKGEYASDV